MKKLRILHVFSSFELGGAQRRFLDIANALDDYQNFVISMSDDETAFQFLKDQTNNMMIEFHAKKGRAIDLVNMSRLKNIIKETNADLLCTYNWGSIEAALANRKSVFGGRLIPHIHFEDGFGPDESPEKQIGRRVMMRKLALRESQLIVPSRILENVAIKQWGLKPGFVHRIENGVDADQFSMATKSPGIVKIATLAMFRKEKNLHRLIEVFDKSRLKDVAELHLIGDGPESNALVQDVFDRGLTHQVHFPGMNSNPAEALREMDIFAITSDTEQMPISVLEAMASGLPVLGTNVGDIVHMVSQENKQYIRDKDDLDGLINGLVILARDPDKRQTIGAANREEVVSRYTKKDMLWKYDNIYRRVAEG